MTGSQSPRSRASEEQDSEWHRYVAELRENAAPPFEEQWERFQRIYSGRAEADGPPQIWQPGKAELENSNLGRFMREEGFGDYAAFHAWSVAERAVFWRKVIRCLGIRFRSEPMTTIDLSGGATRPRWLPGAVMNCTERCFPADPDRIAVITGEEGSSELRKTTYGELHRLVDRFALGLVRQGFQVGQGIALYMPMTLECVVAYLGIIRAGCYVVSIAHSFSPAEVRKRLEIGDARGLVTVEGLARGTRTIPLYEKAREVEAPRAVVVPADRSRAPDLRDGDLLWTDFLGPDDRFDSVVGDPYRMTNILFSSGTTGTPKAIPWTHLTPIKCAMDGHFHQDVCPSDVLAWPTNIGWMMDPWLIYASLMNRAAIALYGGIPTGEGFARFVQDAGVTILGVVPSLVRAWQDLPAMETIDWSRVRLFSSTGEPSGQRDYLWLMSLAGYLAPVIEYCGGTEIGGGHITGTVVQPASPARFTTPALGIDFVLPDEEAHPAGEGEMGEIFLVPPSIGLSQELLNGDHDDVYHAGCPRGPRGEPLRRHGDPIARLHQGFFKARGRADDTMNLGGIKVSSLELEAVIESHEAVYEGAAVSVQPGGEGPERLVVFVVAKGVTGTGQLLQELNALLARRLNPLFRIHDLLVVDSLPRTASNKLMRRALRTRYLDLHRGTGEGGRG